MSLRAEHVRQTRAALVAAARRLFGEQGYASTSVEQIAADAGVTIGALYHHFATKTALFDIMERRGKDRLASGVWEEALAEGDPLAVQLIDEAMAALGAGVASANNLLDVDVIILGGGLGTRLGQPFAG